MKTTPIYGLRYPERGDPPDLPDQLHNLADDVGAAMDALVPDSGVLTGLAVTPATGWSVAKAQYRTIGVRMYLFLQLTRTGAAITADGAGNIGDTLAATITDTAHRPAITHDGLYRAGVTSGSVTIDTVGAVTLRDAHSTSVINTSENINIYAAYTIPSTGAGTLAATDHGLYYPASTDRPIGDGDVTQIALAAESYDTALSALVTDTGTINTGAPITPADGWEILLAEYRLIGKDMYLHVWCKRTGAAITATSAGNVGGDPAVFTVTDPDLRPSLDAAVGQFRASFTGGCYQLSGTTGVCQIFDMHSGSSIAAPTSEVYHTAQFFANYPIP